MTSFKDDVKQLIITTINRNPDFAKPVEDTIDDDEKGVALVRNMAAALLAVHPGADPDDIDAEQIWREVQAQCAIWIDRGTSHLHTVHTDWLTSRMASTQWYFWDSYRSYLESESLLPPPAIRNMDELTSEVLKELGDPQQKGIWCRRGMVVGEVQAGKTANYIGLIDKALDCGYKLVVVLAGTQDDLRSQTQKRLDRGVIGGDTRQRPDGAVGWAKIGVGKYRQGTVKHSVIPLTDARMHGDFSAMKFTGIELGGESPLLLVIKKNARILRRIHNWVQSYAQERNGGQLGVLPDVPLLLVDDEADSASINTHPTDEDQDPAVINGWIRRILNDFGQTSYVGYTATPFANIFIEPDDDASEAGVFGRDLFPTDFIFNLPTPSNYVGPDRLFGLSNPLHQDQTSPGLPLIHYIDDWKTSFPATHKKDFRVLCLPESLKQAIKVFILVGAARRVRGQTCCHNSMLVHVTRFVDVQKQVSDLVQDEVTAIQRILRFKTGDPYVALMRELRALWDDDLSSQRDAVDDIMNDVMLTPVTWADVSREVYEAASKIQVKTVNGLVKDALDYDDYKDVGLSVIAIGGDKLSRGLTLEDISVSYYLRDSTMYDTLLQMGRWFGYKDGFVDLCRLYTTREIVMNYQWVALASHELREDFAVMVQLNRSPSDYGLRVRQHPSVLRITSPGKMRSSRVLYEDDSGKLLQTFAFEKDAQTQERNFQKVKTWVASLPQAEPDDKGCITWTSVRAEQILDLLQGFIVHPRCYKMDPIVVCEYISRQTDQRELRSWTVCIVSTPGNGRTHQASESGPPSLWSFPPESMEPARFSIGKQYPDLWTPVRTDDGRLDPHQYLIQNQQMISPADELRGLTEEELRLALQDTVRAWKTQGSHGREPTRPGSDFARARRSVDQGLLLIYPLRPAGVRSRIGWTDDVFPATPVMGLAISLPYSASATPVVYRGNMNWFEQQDREE